MKISYLVTCSNETDTLKNLLKTLVTVVPKPDEIIILMDEQSGENETHNIIGAFHHSFGCRILKHQLNNDYGAHKNYGVEQCNGDWIFQIDGDEMPPDSLLGENLHSLIESNPDVEAYAIPRINAWHDLAKEHAKRWGWYLDMSPTYKRLRAAWPDYQFRLFKRDYPRISFKKKLHERIEGYSKFALLPMDEDFALYHDKTIEKQIETNLRYNKDFSEDENKGISDERK